MSIHCCGVKNISLSLQEDGSISATVTGFEADVYIVMNEIMRVQNNAYTINSRRIQGAMLTISATSDQDDTYEKIPAGAIFKTIPKDIYDLHMSGIIHRSMQSPLEAPDSDVYIKYSDMYGTNGWRVSEILKMLDINAHIPSAFDYHVYQLTASRGSPIISFIHKLLPVSGLIVEKRFGGYYVSIAKGSAYFAGNTCLIVGQTSKTTKYRTVVAGLPGEPRYIVGQSGQQALCGATVVYNLVGGIWAITETKMTMKSDQIRVESMFDDEKGFIPNPNLPATP